MTITQPVLIALTTGMVLIGALIGIVWNPIEQNTEERMFSEGTTGIYWKSDSDYMYARFHKDCYATIEFAPTSSPNVIEGVKRFDLICPRITQ